MPAAEGKRKGGAHAPGHPRPWKPYEAAPCENLSLRFIPRQFYQARWWLFTHNPLVWQPPGATHTIGEIVAFAIIVLQAAYVLLAWTADIGGLREDVGRTGARPASDRHAHVFLPATTSAGAPRMKAAWYRDDEAGPVLSGDG